jgi:lipopolysaccharide/colanic/teichoic acid biosynthesis glycosyltransferase
MALARGIRFDTADRFDEGLESFGPGFARRALDLTLSSLALVVLAVPMLIVAIAIRLDSRGSSFYRQRRIGQGGAPFSLIKFRTMVHGVRGSMLTGPGDARVTRLGRFLRAAAIDELPQLLNILAGHMTLVGPRPQTPGFASSYPPELQEIFAHRPGLVGPGVLRLNDDDVLPEGMESLEDWYLQNVVPARVQLDLEYLQNPTIRRTLALMAQTLVRVPRRLLARGLSRRASVKAAIASEGAGNPEIILDAGDEEGARKEEIWPLRTALRHRISSHRVISLRDEAGAVSLNGSDETGVEERPRGGVLG